MYSIVEGVAENREVEYCPFCGSEGGFILKSDGKVECSECERKFYVIEDD